MSKRRVVITGLGAVTPVGLTMDETWKGIRQGVCGIGPITLYDTTDRKVMLAAEVKNFDPDVLVGKSESKRMDRYCQFAIVAAKEALADSGLDVAQTDAGRCGVIVSSGIGGLSTTEAAQVRGMERGYDKVSPFFIPSIISNMAAGRIAIQAGFQGMCTCPVTACAGGSNAVGDAFRHIRDGYAEVMLCGGSEACITPLAIGGFTAMKALCTSRDPERACIPFDAERSGFVMGEGAGMLMLEELEHARKRGAKIYAEVVGYGATCDAYHITAPAPDGSGGARAMAQALADGDIRAEQVDYVNAHGISTVLNDAGETAAVKTVFGAHAGKIMMSSTKSMTGHMLGAAGAVEAAITALALRDGFVPATIHYQLKDEACDLDVVPNVGRQADIRVAMSNSLGFGGHNASLVLKKWEE